MKVTPDLIFIVIEGIAQTSLGQAFDHKSKAKR